MYVILQDDFRALVNAELETQKLSRAALARLMGVDPPYVTTYLNGRVDAGTDVIERFLRALGKVPRLVIEDPGHRPKANRKNEKIVEHA